MILDVIVLIGATRREIYMKFERSALKMVLCATIALNAVTMSGCYDALEARYQSEMDPRRVDDVQTIADLLRRYEATTGFFPLEQRGLQLPIAVDLAPGGIPAAWQQANAGRPGTAVPFDEFVAELERGLGEKITLPKDPQKVPTVRPAWYQYQFNGKDAHVAASLSSPLPGTRKVRDSYFKYEIRVLRTSKERGLACIRDSDCPANELCSCPQIVDTGPDRCRTVAPHTTPGFCFHDDRNAQMP